MSWLGNLVRRARLRSLTEGLVQKARAEALEGDAKDDAERWQDYGFAAQPVEGQGLVINAGGHTIVLRMDRISERPALAAYEVAVWHRDGHVVKLKAGRVVEVDCDHFIVNAAASVVINAPVVTVNASEHVELATPLTHSAGTISGDTDVLSGDISLKHHRTSGVKRGVEVSDGPVP